MSDNVRELTFEEEAALYEKEARAEFLKEHNGADSPNVNSILRRGMRIIRKARELIAFSTIEQPTWISCAVRLPEEAGEYIVMTNALGKSKGVMAMEYRFTQVRGKPVKRWEWNNRISPWIVTHWMPLPQPPKEGE